MIATIGLIAGIIYLGLLFFKMFLAITYYRRQDGSFRDDRLTPEQASEFCVVQPILSGDPKLEWTLHENAKELQANVKFFWMVDTDDPEAIEICERLRAQHNNHSVRISIFYCQPAPTNQNPKTWKLQIALDACNSPYFVVLDDDTTIDDSCLVAASKSLKDHALYTGLPIYRRGESKWSDLVSHFVANNSVLTYLPPLLVFEPITINGMFYVTRSDKLRGLGGFTKISDALCDDYALKKLYSQANERIHQGISYQKIATSLGSFGEYHRLLHRWTVFAIQLVKDQRLVVQVFLATLLGLPPILLLVCITTSLSQFWTLGWLAVVLIVRDTVLRTTQRLVFGSSASMNLFLSVIAECLQPLHLISASVLPSIQWRRRTIQVGRGMW